MPNISVSNLSIEFRIYGANARSLRKSLMSKVTGGRLLPDTRQSIVIRALDGVSIEIKAGERVGLIGHNGSGKTTLLRALAGIYHPTAGVVTLTGSVGALLDPFAGIDGDATGLENIYLRGRLLGMGKSRIRRHLDEIIDLTELEGFIHLPMRTYSAGMFARLSFAVSAAISPDILLMDEGFGAGDAGFVQKMRERLLFLKPESILVLASHDLSLIGALCNRTIRFDHGRIDQNG